MLFDHVQCCQPLPRAVECTGMYTSAFISEMQDVETNVGIHGCLSDNLLFLVYEIIIV